MVGPLFRRQAPPSRWIAVGALVASIALAWGSFADARRTALACGTLELALAVCLIALPLGTLLALVLARTNAPLRKPLAVLLSAMAFVPLYVQAAGWQAGFGVLGAYTLSTGEPPWLDGFRGAVWVHTMAAMPWVVLIVGFGLRLMPAELEEQALMDGSAWQVFCYLTLRRAATAACVAAVWIATTVAGEMTVTDFFQVRTIAEEVYTNQRIGEDSTVVVLWTAVESLAVAAALVAVHRLARTQDPASTRPPMLYRLGWLRWPAALAAAAAVGLVIAVPLASLTYKTGVIVTQSGAERTRAWSAEKCWRVVAESPVRYASELGWSAAIGGLAATAAVVLGLLLACPARRGGWAALPALIVAAVLPAVAGPAIGLALETALNHPGHPLLNVLYDRTIAAPAIAQTIRALPPATLVLWYGLCGTSRDLLDMAAVDGAGPIARLVRVVLPARWPALALAWLVALAVALGELSATILVLPPGVGTIGVEIFRLLHWSAEDLVAGICLFLWAAVVVVGGVAAWFSSRWR